MPAQARKAHVQTLRELVGVVSSALGRLPADQGTHKAQRAATVLDRALEELMIAK